MKEANKIIFDFIWKGKDKVKRSALISDIEDGGLKAPHLNSIIETQRILCCKKLANDQPSGWKIILLHYLKPVGGKLVLCCDFDLKKLTIKLPSFYEECLKSFAKCSAVNNLNIQDLNGKDLSKVILWNNKSICVGDKSVYFRNLAEKGIFRVGDLISNKHELIIKSELRVLNLSPLDAFRLVSLIDALPTQWRESLKSCIYTGDTPFNLRDEIKLRLSGQIVLLEKAYSKIVYKELRDRIVTPPTAKLKFDANFVNDTLNWKKTYSLPYRVALDTKTREFQYKLLNRCLVTNTFLCKIGMIPSPAWSLCGKSDESLEHLFLSCHYTKNFLSEVIKWLVDHKVKIENLSDKDILFGIIGCEDEIFVNHILLLAKQYLYSCRQNKYPPSIRVLHSKINTVFLIETMIAKSKNKLETHNMKWGKYKTDTHTTSSPLTSFIIKLYFLFILFYFLFHVNRKEGTWFLFRLFSFL